MQISWWRFISHLWKHQPDRSTVFEMRLKTVLNQDLETSGKEWWWLHVLCTQHPPFAQERTWFWISVLIMFKSSCSLTGCHLGTQSPYPMSKEVARAVAGYVFDQGLACQEGREPALGNTRREGGCAAGQANPEQPPKTDHKQAVSMEQQQSLRRPR